MKTKNNRTSRNNIPFLFVVADLNGRKLRVPKYVMDKVSDLHSAEAALLNKYCSKYPGFKIEVFDSIYLEGLGLFTQTGVSL